MTTRPENDDGQKPTDKNLSSDNPSSSEDLASSIVTAMTSGQEKWSGPLPPRELFAAYEKESPGVSEKLLRMFEDEVRYKNERARRFERSARIAQASQLVVAVLISVGSLVAAFALDAQQENSLAVFTAVFPVVAIVVGGGAAYFALRRGGQGGGRQ